MDASHPLRIALGQIVIDRDDMDPLACQGVEIRRGCGYQSLSFAGLHLRNTSLVQNDAADQLHRIVFHI